MMMMRDKKKKKIWKMKEFRAKYHCELYRQTVDKKTID